MSTLAATLGFGWISSFGYVLLQEIGTSMRESVP